VVKDQTQILVTLVAFRTSCSFFSLYETASNLLRFTTRSLYRLFLFSTTVPDLYCRTVHSGCMYLCSLPPLVLTLVFIFSLSFAPAWGGGYNACLSYFAWLSVSICHVGSGMLAVVIMCERLEWPAYCCRNMLWRESKFRWECVVCGW